MSNWTISSFLLLLLRVALTAVVMFFAFKYGLLVGAVTLGIWWVLDGVFGTERTVRFLREDRPSDGVDREVYDKLMKFKDRTGGSIFAEQFFATITIMGIYCLIGWKLGISPVYVILASVASDLLTWPYSLSRIRQVATEETGPQQYVKDEKDVKEILAEFLDGE